MRLHKTTYALLLLLIVTASAPALADVLHVQANRQDKQVDIHLFYRNDTGYTFRHVTVTCEARWNSTVVGRGKKRLADGDGHIDPGDQIRARLVVELRDRFVNQIECSSHSE